MSSSLHHAKGPSELPQIPRYSPQRTKLILKNYNPLKEIQNKNTFRLILCKDSTCFQESSLLQKQNKSQNNHSEKQNRFKKNSYNPKTQTISLGLGFPNMLKKKLQKNKKYLRVDANLKTQNNIIKNDMECLIENLVQQKQRNDLIVLNLRDKFQTKKKSLSLNKRNTTFIRANQRNSTKIALQKDEVTCVIPSLNHFTQSGGNMKDSKQYKEQLNGQQFMGAISLLNKQIKNFKQIMRQHIYTLKLSINQESSVNYSSIFGISENMTQSLIYKSSNREGKKEDKTMGNMAKCRSEKKLGNVYFKEFIQLTEKSQDYLEYYLKSSFTTQYSASVIHNDELNQCNSPILKQTREQIQKMLTEIDKNAILSVLRSSCKCLQPAYNQKEIVNRILLALNINPMNKFHFIQQQTFTKFRKLMTGQASRKESREFLLRYFCLENTEVNKSRFDNLLYCVLNKLLPVLNDSTVEILYQKVKKICQLTIILIRAQSQKEAKNKNQNDGKKTTFKSGLQPNRINLDKQKDLEGTDTKKEQRLHGINQCSVRQSYYKRQQIKLMLFQDPFDMWDQILQLIFMV